MNSKVTKVMAGVLVMLSCAAASAQDGVIRARAGISNNDFTSIFSGGELKSKYNSLNTGVTYIQSSGWYVDGAVKTSLSADWTASGTAMSGYKRQDLTLTVGKALSDGIQVFGGYQQANSTIGFPANWGGGADEKFNVKGYFVGAGKTIPVPVGSVNLNLAVGQMKGRLMDQGSTWFNSDTGTGTSFGATYSYPLAEKTTLSVEYKRQAYKYDFSSRPGTAGDDKVSTFGANISYQF